MQKRLLLQRRRFLYVYKESSLKLFNLTEDKKGEGSAWFAMKKLLCKGTPV